MLAHEFDQYLLSTYELESQSVLNQIQAADMPHMKKEQRTERFNKLAKMGYPEAESKKRHLTLEALAAKLSGGIR